MILLTHNHKCTFVSDRPPGIPSQLERECIVKYILYLSLSLLMPTRITSTDHKTGKLVLLETLACCRLALIHVLSLTWQKHPLTFW